MNVQDGVCASFQGTVCVGGATPTPPGPTPPGPTPPGPTPPGPTPPTPPSPTPPNPALKIAGVEATQAIKYFAFNGQGSGYAADNTVPLVAEKPLTLRVYVDRQGSAPERLSGTVIYNSASTGAAAQLTPLNGPITGMAAGAIDRGNPDHTLNFLVPAADCKGSVSFTITVADANDPNNHSEPLATTLNFDAVPAVRVQAVLFRWTGSEPAIPAPTREDLESTLGWVARAYPIPAFNYTVIHQKEFNFSLGGSGSGGCGAGWDDLMNMLRQIRNESGTDDVFVGIIPKDVPRNDDVIGCGGGGVAISFVDLSDTFAQEIGHAFDRRHAPCGVAGDPNYPTYNNYPSASIGEFGFDYGSSPPEIHNPAETYDFMSYCGPNWISPYTYIGLKSAIAEAVAAAHARRPEISDFDRQYLHLGFRVSRVRAGKPQVRLLYGRHFTHRRSLRMRQVPSPITCEFRNSKDEVLARHRCSPANPHHQMGRDSLHMDFHEVAVWMAETAKIVFFMEDEELASYPVGISAPQVGSVTVDDSKPDEVTVRWTGSSGTSAEPSGPVGEEKKDSVEPDIDQTRYLLRYTADEGRTWTLIVTDYAKNQYTITSPSNLMVPGKKGKFQVIASRKFRSSEPTESRVVSRPAQAGKAVIVSPARGSTFKQGQAVLLKGYGAFGAGAWLLNSADFVWASNRDGILGTGRELVTRNLSVGRHRIMLSVPDGAGDEAVGMVLVTVTPHTA